VLNENKVSLTEVSSASLGTVDIKFGINGICSNGFNLDILSIKSSSNPAFVDARIEMRNIDSNIIAR